MIVSHDYGYDEEAELFDEVITSIINTFLLPAWVDELYRPTFFERFIRRLR